MMDMEDWKSHVRRRTLENCILVMLSQKTYYGYEMIQSLSKYPILTTKESTIYPLLRRLEKEQYLKATW
jgi:PadR family transcriptional regulator PadR